MGDRIQTKKGPKSTPILKMKTFLFSGLIRHGIKVKLLLLSDSYNRNHPGGSVNRSLRDTLYWFCWFISWNIRCKPGWHLHIPRFCLSYPVRLPLQKIPASDLCSSLLLCSFWSRLSAESRGGRCSSYGGCQDDKRFFNRWKDTAPLLSLVKLCSYRDSLGYLRGQGNGVIKST